ELLLFYHLHPFQCVLCRIDKLWEAALVCVCHIEEPDDTLLELVVEVLSGLEFLLGWAGTPYQDALETFEEVLFGKEYSTRTFTDLGIEFIDGNLTKACETDARL